MTTRTAVGPLRRYLAGARAVGAALTYTTPGDTTFNFPSDMDRSRGGGARSLRHYYTQIETIRIQQKWF